MMSSKLEIMCTFIEPLLGTAPSDKNIYQTYIQGVANGAGNGNGHDDELDSLPVMDDKGRTVFHRNAEGKPILYDYQIKGFLKDACSMQMRFEVSESKKLKAYKKIIDGLVFVWPRQIEIIMPEGMEVGVLERPLRAQTAMGERVALASSESIAEGAKVVFEVESMNRNTVTKELIKEWFNYGRYRGLGQWRNGSFGRFRYQINALTSNW